MNLAQSEAQRPPAAARRGSSRVFGRQQWNFADERCELGERPSPYADWYRKLCLAFFEGVVRDCVQHQEHGHVMPVGTTTRGAEISRATAGLHAWVAGGDDYALSLDTVCGVLDLDPDGIRQGLQRMLATRIRGVRRRGEPVVRRTNPGRT